MDNLPEWFINARERIRSETKKILCDSEELAAQYGLRMGDTVIVRHPRPFIADTQANLDEHMAREWMREYPELM